MLNSKNWSTTLAITALGIALVAGGQAAAAAHEGPPPAHHGKMMGRMMEKIDTDGDGQVSRDEFAAFHTDKFNKMDSNGDNSIDADERKAHHEQMKGKFKGAHEKRQRHHQDAE